MRTNLNINILVDNFLARLSVIFYAICISNEITNCYSLKNSPESTHITTTRILYISPAKLEDEHQLNNEIESIFGSTYQKGWHIEANKKHKFNLFISIDFTNLTKTSSNETLNNTKSTNSALARTIIRSYSSRSRSVNATNMLRHIFYVYFTLDSSSCDDYLNHSHIPIYFDFSWSEIYKTKYLLRLEMEIELKHEPILPYYICFNSNEHVNEEIQDYATNDTLNSIFYLEETTETSLFVHQGTSNFLMITTHQHLLPIWFKIVIYIVLILLNSILNGLNLGLMALSIDELKLLIKTSDSLKERKYAKNILPLRRKGNFLLCSILLSITFTSSVSTLLLDSMIEGLFAGIISTLILCMIGEILPQAICSRYALMIGSYTRYLTYFFIYVTTTLSYPLGKIVDYVLGDELPTVYSRDLMKELIKKAKGIEEKQCKIISGALDLKTKRVADVMIKLNDVFMLHEDEKLNFENIVKIYNTGYSRVPVYQSSREDIVGWFHIKDLTLVDPDDEIKIKKLISIYKHKNEYCYSNDDLCEMFEIFRRGTHMSFVLELVQNADTDPYEKCVGIITLHDVLEALIQLNIYDEIKGYTTLSNKPAHGSNYLKKLIENYRRMSLLGSNDNSSNTYTDSVISREVSLPSISLQTKLAILQILSSNTVYIFF
jgi:CBS domain containing-hemolysin-like protein